MTLTSRQFLWTVFALLISYSSGLPARKPSQSVIFDEESCGFTATKDKFPKQDRSVPCAGFKAWIDAKEYRSKRPWYAHCNENGVWEFAEDAPKFNETVATGYFTSGSATQPYGDDRLSRALSARCPSAEEDEEEFTDRIFVDIKSMAEGKGITAVVCGDENCAPRFKRVDYP